MQKYTNLPLSDNLQGQLYLLGQHGHQQPMLSIIFANKLLATYFMIDLILAIVM